MENGFTLRDFFEEYDFTKHEIKFWKGEQEFEGGLGKVHIHNSIIEIELSWSKEFLASAGGRCAETSENYLVLDGNTPAKKYKNGQVSAVNNAGTSIFICAKGGVAPNPVGKL